MRICQWLDDGGWKLEVRLSELQGVAGGDGFKCGNGGVVSYLNEGTDIKILFCLTPLAKGVRGFYDEIIYDPARRCPD